MIKTYNIKIAIDTESGKAVGVNIESGVYDNCVIIEEEIDEPVAINRALNEVMHYFEDEF